MSLSLEKQFTDLPDYGKIRGKKSNFMRVKAYFKNKNNFMGKTDEAGL